MDCVMLTRSLAAEPPRVGDDPNVKQTSNEVTPPDVEMGDGDLADASAANGTGEPLYP